MIKTYLIKLLNLLKAGNTPQMHAVIHKKVKLLTYWLKDPREASLIDMRTKNREGKTLFMLFVEHLDINMVRLLVKVRQKVWSH